MTALAAQKPWLSDPQSLPVPWRIEEEKLPEKLCFGFAWGDGVVAPSPPLRRAMEITKEKLLAAGHIIIDYEIKDASEVYNIVRRMWSADGGQEFQRDTDASGEPLQPQVEKWLGHSANVKPMTVFETWQNQHRRDQLSTEWLESWERTAERTGTGRPIDGLIMPSTPFPAVRHRGGYQVGQLLERNLLVGGESEKLRSVADVDCQHHYGTLSPLFDLTTGIFPVTKVDLEKDVEPTDWKPSSELEKQVTEYCKEIDFQNRALEMRLIVFRRQTREP